MSGYQMYQGQKDKKEAERDNRDYNRGDLTNPYMDMPISTVGSDLLREETGRANASMVDASRNAGIRGIYGNIPKIVANTNAVNAETRAYLDDQVQKRNYAIAGDETAIREINESRDTANLAGIGQRMEVGRQDMWSGLRGLGATAMMVANASNNNNNNGGNFNFASGADFSGGIGWKPTSDFSSLFSNKLGF